MFSEAGGSAVNCLFRHHLLTRFDELLHQMKAALIISRVKTLFTGVQVSTIQHFFFVYLFSFMFFSASQPVSHLGK